jgi:hypothetical protein
MIKPILSTIIVIFLKNLIYTFKSNTLSSKLILFDLLYYFTILIVTSFIYFLGLEKMTLPSSFIDIINFILIYVFSKCLLEFLFIFTFSNASYAILPFIHKAKLFIENYNLIRNIKNSLYFLPFIVINFLLYNYNSIDFLFYAFLIIIITTICKLLKMKTSNNQSDTVSEKTEI